MFSFESTSTFPITMNVLGQLLHENIFDFNKSFSCKTHFRKVGIDTNLNEEEEEKIIFFRNTDVSKYFLDRKFIGNK